MRRLFVAAALCVCALSLASAQAGEVLDKPYQDILAFTMGGDAGPLNAVAELALKSFSNADERKKVERQLLAALQSPKATTDCKRFICRQLVVIGSEQSVAPLAALLLDKELSHMARYALARLEGDAPGKALRDALAKASGQPKLGIIGSLGDRRDAAAVPALAALAKSGDLAVAQAAVAALGKIGGAASLAALDTAAKSAKPTLANVAVDAKLRVAGALLAEGKQDQARGIYDALYTTAKAVHVRAAALRGLVLCGGDKASELVMRPLLGNDAALQAAAVGLIREVPGQAATKTFAAQLPKLSPTAQALLISALAEREDKAAAAAVLAAAKSPEASVRLAAIRALGVIGDAAAVPSLIAAAVTGQGDEATSARASLIRISDPKANAAILAALAKGDAKVRGELVRTLAARRAIDAVPALIKLVDDPDEGVRREAFKAIGTLAGEKALPELVRLMIGAKGDSARRAAEKAVVTIASRLESEDARTAAMLSALPTATDEGKTSLLRILARFGGAKALAAVEAAAKGPEGAVKDAAIRSLVTWPDAAAADTLLGIIKTTKSNTHRVLSLRGYVRMVALPSSRSADETLQQCKEAMGLATNVAEKKLVLSAMANVHHPKAIEIIKPYAADPQLKAEAAAAMAKIKKAMNAPAKATASHGGNKARNALDGKPATRWDTGTPMKPGMWFMMEFGLERTFTKLTLECKKSANDYPRGYEVYVSRDAENWGKPVAKGAAKSSVVTITLQPASGRFLKIVQTGSSKGNFWSIHTLKVESK
ncbi:HEAT repeat domain-containing protein [bacterium]|nr:HEAT repeat domain-containing protein [bacterium]